MSTGSFDIKLSLGTTDLATARTSPRKLSADSDTVIQRLPDKRTISVEPRQLLAEVIRREHDKIENLSLMRRFDSSRLLDDQRHDQTAAGVWQHIATEGSNAQNPTGVSGAHLFHQIISVMRTYLASKARR